MLADMIGNLRLSYVFLALCFVCSGADTNEIPGLVNHCRWRRNWCTESLLKNEEEDEKEVE
jgi:hypothetical protein